MEQSEVDVEISQTKAQPQVNNGRHNWSNGNSCLFMCFNSFVELYWKKKFISSYLWDDQEDSPQLVYLNMDLLTAGTGQN